MKDCTEPEKAQGLYADRPSREKYWREQLLHQQSSRMEELERQLNQLGSQFPNHKHVDGQVVTPLPASSPNPYFGLMGSRIGATTKDSEDFYI